MKQFGLLLCAFLAVGCIQQAQEEKKDPPPPVSNESKTVTERVGVLVAEAQGLKANTHTTGKEASCYAIGGFAERADAFMSEIHDIALLAPKKDEILKTWALLQSDLKLVELACLTPHSIDTDLKAWDDQFRANIDRMVNGLMTIHSMAKTGTIPDLKPLTAQATPEDINAGNYPSIWGYRADLVRAAVSFLETKLTHYSSGRSCQYFAGMQVETMSLMNTLKAFPMMPAAVQNLAATLDQKTMALKEYCKGTPVMTKQFAETLPFLRRDMKEIEKIAADLATLL
ncbi:MAG TPA: hypothetical protein VFV50_11655 [Bdellovibrionales bacterium]|nr:hypothetical protein [Bdellovibrionales bacterium]